MPSSRDLSTRAAQILRHHAVLCIGLFVGIEMVVTFLLGEMMVRMVKPPILAMEFGVFLATPAIISDEYGAVRLLPQSKVRYAFATEHGVEFQAQLRTNNLGYIDDRDYPLPADGNRTIAFIGDSYAVGAETGEPWVPQLRERTGATLYSLGIPGTGVAHFERGLESFARSVGTPPEIVIVATSDDFYRPLWKPLRLNDGIRLCAPGASEVDCGKQVPSFYAVDANISREGLEQKADELLHRLRPPPSFLRRTLRHSDLIRLVSRFSNLGRIFARQRVYEPSITALRVIRTRFPDATIRFVHAADKFETASGKYFIDIGGVLADLRIDYFPVLKECPLGPHMYFSRDNHPNADGYRHLSTCVARYLALPARG